LSSSQGSGSPLGVEEALDIIEGLVAGGLVGLGAFIIGGAVAALPGSFLTVAEVTPISVIGGALAFVGTALHQIRARNGW
jgi:uncharacterized membrane protein YGL010W